MFFRPGFLGTRGSSYGAGNPIPIEAIPPIHGAPGQGTQGGVPAVIDNTDPDNPIVVSPGQYYHISAALYSFLIGLASNRFYTEPVMSLTGAILTSSTGDIMMSLIRLPVVPVPDIPPL